MTTRINVLACAGACLLVANATWGGPAHAAPPVEKAKTAVAGPARLGRGVEHLIGVYESKGRSQALRQATGRRLRVRSEKGLSLVPVILEPVAGRAARDIDSRQIRFIGGRVDAVSKSYLRVWVPVSRLRSLAAFTGVQRARFATRATELGMGSCQSEAPEVTHAAVVQAQGRTGAGVDVAVVDLGFQGLSAAISGGDLPADTVIVDLPGSGDNPIEAVTPHGVAVAEQVMDMAPGATLHVIRVSDEVDMENAAAYLHNNGVEVANHSVAWVIASYYDDTGPIDAIIDDSHDVDGVFWAVAAGNFAASHWRGAWSDPDGDGYLNWRGTDPDLEIGPANVGTIYLNWDQYGNSVTDLDLFIMNRYGHIVTSSSGLQTGPQDPSEAVAFTYDAGAAPYTVRVRHYSGPVDDLDITLFSFGNSFEYATSAASIMEPASAHGAVSVAATAYSEYANPYPVVEWFSSVGPTTDFRFKPDLTAPDGTTTCTYGTNGSYGTSFASPVVAGAAALFLGDDPTLTPDELLATMAHTALDAGSPGWDSSFGIGLLWTELRPDCDDGIDNDGDGAADYPDDTSCQGLFSTDEGPACDDGVDDDGDGLVDFPEDPGCITRYSDRENPACDDGVDNDGDGLIDFGADPGCGSAAFWTEAPQCDDGIDNDGDGQVDLADNRCRGSGDTSEQCGLGFELSLILPILALCRKRKGRTNR